MGHPRASLKRHPTGVRENASWSATWSYIGDSVEHLLNCKSAGVVQVAYTYDSMGRMLTRTPYTSGVAGTATTFEWDGWDMIREVTPAGTYRYYAPQGEILTFDFTTSGGSPVTSSYNVIADAIGSVVRAITDSTGAVVAHYEYEPWVFFSRVAQIYQILESDVETAEMRFRYFRGYE